MFSVLPIAIPSPKVVLPTPHFIEIAYAEAPEIPLTAIGEPYATSSLPRLVSFYASKYKVSSSTMLKVVKCEDPLLDPKKQSEVVDGKGSREDSWGLAQFHLPAGNKTPDGRVITKDIATDPDEALNAMAWYFSQNRQAMWTCWRDIFGK